MRQIADYADGPRSPVKIEIGGKVFWVVVNRDGNRLAETERNARLIAEALNSAAQPAIASK